MKWYKVELCGGAPSWRDNAQARACNYEITRSGRGYRVYNVRRGWDEGETFPTLAAAKSHCEYLEDCRTMEQDAQTREKHAAEEYSQHNADRVARWAAKYGVTM